ncbi:choice-of-anchor B family protein [Thalassotalea castellviae]|uniref:Choice-of-anchor B family protein n=1 Tax=Thalassotalea castellviae TaxID=3075612 RepID=A0ABU2ZZS8_9GAMM|nr:choice-of-anchor B family protein [Thalassotalea sp. W431]MDT0603428.1 choice-of-anchor B family protein [Thalassotalea sp. W431]
MNKFFTLLSLTGLLSISISAYSHSEHDKSRFVSPNGTDNSRCDNVLRPCKSISYAVSQANKGDKILLSAGEFQITSSDELFYLKSALVPIYGGYNRFDHFQSQSPQSNVTTLKNVPYDMTETLRKKGFHIIADGKSFANDKQLKTKLASYQQLSESQKDASCVDGKADIFDCENIDLLAHLPLTQMSSKPSSGSDIWGHVDLNTGNEFALMTINNGVIIVDVSNPSEPVEVGTISGVNSSWRDVKVYQHFDESINLWQAYAYVTTEGYNGGVSIIDLNNLPHSVSLIEKNNVVSTSHNIYISNVDYSLNIPLPDQTASLQLVGANTKSGAFQNYSLATPTTLNLSSAKNYGNGYTHDGTSLVVDDQRAVNDCALLSGSCTVFVDFNEKEMKLWNITDPENATQLGSAEYNDVAKSNQYVHSGWGTEDKQFVLLHDEFDENRGGLNTTVRIFSIENLTSPIQVGQWTGPTRAIDHNGFVRGNRYYMSNYERGLTILDITDPTSPTQVGFFDTYTPSNSANFNGAWGVYPFLPSGNILVSDINSGLYVLKDNAKTSAKGKFAFTKNTFTTEQGVNLSIDVQRNGTETNEAVAVSYQIIQGSAQAGSDFVVANDTLTWAANDNADKTINIEIKDDLTASEFQESFFIRLYNPINGAVLGENSYATVNIIGIVDSGSGTFTENAVTLSENTGEYVVEVNRIGSTTGELTFNYQLTASSATLGSDVEDKSGEISWADGDSTSKEITLTIINDEIEEENETFVLSLSAVDNARVGTHGEILFTITDDDKNEAPTVTLGESFQVNTEQTVELSAEASDSNDDEMTYLWEQTSGTSITLTNADSLTASFIAPTTADSLVFNFTATDYRGAATTASITISVVAPTEVITVTPQKSSGGGSTTWLTLLSLMFIFPFRSFRNSQFK